MSTKRRIEVFRTGCPACQETQAMVRRLACPSGEIIVLDMHDSAVAAKAKAYRIHTVPAVVVDGRVAPCCGMRGPVEATLKTAGVGLPLP